MIPFQISWHLLLLVLAQVNSESNIIEGMCTWSVRTKERTVPASVYTVNFFACQSGQLTWENPYGAVQMTFKSGVPQETKGTYQVCISSKNNGFDIFTRNEGNGVKDFTSEVCFSSEKKKMIIYVESKNDVNTNKAVFVYRTVFLGNGHGSLRPKDCRVCSRQELIKSFCSGDFAVHGNVKSVSTIGGSENRGEAVVVVKRILHQTTNIFQNSSDTSEILGNVNFPLYCHWKKHVKRGYLFTGNLKIGEGPVVLCRIKFGLWRRLYHKNICDSMIIKT